MRYTYLDILEQCFHDKFRGYSKQEVDTFLQFVAEDFKEMSDEISQLRTDNNQRKIKIDELEKKLKLAGEHSKNKNKHEYSNGSADIPPEILKEKAKKIIEKAKEQATYFKQDAEKELHRLQSEIKHLKVEKKDLLDNFKANARDYLQSLQGKKNGKHHVNSNKKV